MSLLALGSRAPRLFTAALTLCILSAISNGLPDCTSDVECGWKAVCSASTCECDKNLTWAQNKRDCKTAKCKDSRCLECSRPDRCTRCIDFIEQGSGKCLDVCKGSYVLMVDGSDFQGKVCTVSGNMMMTIYIAVIIGVGAGILFTSILALVFYWRLRRYKRKTKIEVLKNRAIHNATMHHVDKSMSMEKSIPPAAPRFSSFDNQSYASHIESYSRPPPPPHAMGRSAFFAQLAILRPYTDSFLNMIQEAKDRNHSLAANDDRALVYRNMIHQLCRVVELLTIPLNQVVVPVDGEALLAWAHKVLHNYLKVQGEYSEASSSVSSAPVTSTFKPDHLLVPNGYIGMDSSHGSSPSNTYKYERCESGTSGTPSTGKTSSGSGGNKSQGGITLSDDFTEPIEV